MKKVTIKFKNRAGDLPVVHEDVVDCGPANSMYTMRMQVEQGSGLIVGVATSTIVRYPIEDIEYVQEEEM